MHNWPHVDPLLARATMDIATALNPQGWTEVAPEDEPNTFDAVCDFFLAQGKIAVTRKAGFINGSKRLWGTADVWQAFFVWHDWSHIHACKGSFDGPGERRTHALQTKHLREWASRLPALPSEPALQRCECVLEAHNIARLDSWRAREAPPDNLRDFTDGYLVARGFAVQPTIFSFPEEYPHDVREWIAKFLQSLRSS